MFIAWNKVKTYGKFRPGEDPNSKIRMMYPGTSPDTVVLKSQIVRSFAIAILHLLSFKK
jgi:hypothetical protein